MLEYVKIIRVCLNDCNHGYNIWKKLYKKEHYGKKSIYLAFSSFTIALKKLSFWQGN